jgi:circadian clock protein KaiC
MYVLKARGMAHSNQVHEFRLTDHGIDLIDVYVGQGNVLTGTARMAQEMRDASDEKRQHEDLARKKRESLRKSEILRGQMAALQLQLEMEEADGTQLALLENELQQKQVDERQEMARARKANITAATAPSSRPGRATAKRRVKP